MASSAPTLHYEGLLLTEMTGRAATFANVAADVLLPIAGEGLSRLRPGFDALAATLPRVTRHEFAGLDHGGSSDRSKTHPGGKPEVVAAEVGPFFAQAYLGPRRRSPGQSVSVAQLNAFSDQGSIWLRR
jgi:hypothetical protein